MALLALTPGELFGRFTDHINGVLHRTICDAPLCLLQARGSTRAEMTFRRGQTTIAAPLRHAPWHLWIGQVLEAQEAGKEWRLRTLSYGYRIQCGAALGDPCLLRFEYEPQGQRNRLHPRHHLHIEATVNVPASDPTTLDSLHIPTGWVTIEELIRFLVTELRVDCHTPHWDAILRESEEMFREWTDRRI